MLIDCFRVAAGGDSEQSLPDKHLLSCRLCLRQEDSAGSELLLALTG